MPGDPAAGLALEEALARAGPPRPLLRLWQNPPCVVVGRAQRVSREVDLAACAADRIPVLRRASGGGTVYQDLGTLNISLAVPGREPGTAAGLAALVAGAVARLGLRPVAGERGVFIGAAKVSGLASQVTRDGTVAHATLLVTTPPGRVWAYLSPAPADRHALDSRRSPVLPLCAHDPALDMAACQYAVLAEAAARYGPLSPRPLRPAERGWQARLLAERYLDPSWHQTGHPAALAGDACPAQGQRAQGQPAQGQPAQGQPAQGQPAQTQPRHAHPGHAHSQEAPPAGPQPKEAQWTTRPVLSSTG